MNAIEKMHRNLRRFYRKELKKVDALKVEACSDYFYVALRYFRDRHILAAPFRTELSKDADFVSLCAAISEYESYYNCVLDYYDVGEDGEPVQKNKELTPEEASVHYKAEMALHWGFF